MAKNKPLLDILEEDDIKQAIMNAELDTSAEIMVHVEDICVGDPKIRAQQVFEKLNIKNTELRNGILFYAAFGSRKFAIVCDEGINKIIENKFWNTINQELINYFRESKFTEGLIEAITQTGELLKKYFPFFKEDVNELPDDISYGKNIV